ncbi:hypothetical protein CU098_004560 [Rhizopus stolonifer]|uniref:PQ-loop-domain-containing protein n=2 Tax=Mucorineae TaxID=1344963 RepID=A0A367IK71_RHIST|nr:hypothetical protein CU098_004560 [Rhizopus stolonifer]
MVNRYLVEQVCSYFGLVFWSLQLAPQAWKTYRRGTSTGVSVWTMWIWTFAGIFLGCYNVGLKVTAALCVQPQIFAFISTICVFQEFRYQHKWSLIKTWVGFILACLLFGGFEAGMVFAFRKAEQMNNEDAIRFFGIIPVVFVIGGFLPQYYEIFRERRVIGVSHLFLAMDFSGSIFSIVSLVFSDNIDALDLVNYIAISCLDVGILVLYYIFEWYQNRLAKQKDIEAPTVKELTDDYEDAHNTKPSSSEAYTKTTS